MSDNITISKSLIKKILLAGGIIVLLIIVGIGTVLYKGWKEKSMAESKMTEIMNFMEKKDYKGVYSTVSSEFQKNVPVDQIETLAKTMNYLFDGFESVSFNSFQVNSGTQYGTYYEYSGPVKYDNGDTGSSLVRFVKENGELKVLYFNVKVSAERVKLFEKK